MNLGKWKWGLWEMGKEQFEEPGKGTLEIEGT